MKYILAGKLTSNYMVSGIQKSKNISHFQEYFKNKEYSDDFGWNHWWNEEIERWLSTIKRIDRKHYNKQKNRVNNKKKRDELLGEYKAIYFIREKLGLDILNVEPPSIYNCNNDFSFEDARSVVWYVEVKSPSWEAEVFKEDQLSHKQKVKRKGKPQFISGEGRAVSVDVAIVDSVKKSRKQFNSKNNNLLMICPNMFAATALLAAFDKGHKVKEILKIHDKEGLIDCILILETCLYTGDDKVVYPNTLVSVSNQRPRLRK